MTRLRVGILGCGGIARRHAVTVTRSSDTELVAFSDRNQPKSQAYAEEFTGGRAQAFTDLHTMLREARPQILIVCLPPGAHTEAVEAASAAGVHLLVEKPLALDSADAWAMVRTAEAAGIRTQVGFMYRFGAAVEAFQAGRRDGSIGRIGMFDARYYCNSLHAYWWRDRSRSGGQLLEQGAHHIDLMRYLMGEPETVFASRANVFHRDMPDYTIEDVGVAVATYRDGPVGVLRFTNGAVPGRWDKAFSVVAENATLHATDHNTAVLHQTSEAGPPPADITAEDRALDRQLLDLVTAIRTGGETRTPIREGARSLDLALALVRSAETGVPVVVAGEQT